MNYQLLKAKYERTKKANEALHAAIEAGEELIEADPAWQKLNKAQEEAFKKAHEAQNLFYKYQDKLVEEHRKPHSDKLQDRDHWCGAYQFSRLEELFKEAEAKERAKEVAKKGVFSVEDAQAFAKGLIDDTNRIYDGPGAFGDDKHGKFYEKQKLKNGTTIYHNKADDYQGYDTCGYNTYFAFNKKGQFLGMWRKYRMAHPGDWQEDSSSDVEGKKFEGLTYYEWKNKIAEVEA